MAPAVGGHAGVGEVAVEHQGADAPAWGCSTRPEAGQVGLAARTAIRCGHGTGGRALQRRGEAGEGCAGYAARRGR